MGRNNTIEKLELFSHKLTNINSIYRDLSTQKELYSQQVTNVKGLDNVLSNQYCKMNIMHSEYKRERFKNETNLRKMQHKANSLDKKLRIKEADVNVITTNTI